MFGLRFFRQKEKQTPAEDIVADESKHCPNSHCVASTTAPVSVNSAEAGKTKKTKRSWRKRLFGRHEKKENTREEESDTSIKSTETTQTAKKNHWWHQLFKCCKRRHRVSPAPEEEPEKRPTRIESNSSPHEDDVVPFDQPPVLLDQETIMEQIITETDCVSTALEEAPKKRPTRIESHSSPHEDDMVPFDQPLEEPLALFGGQQDILEDCPLPPVLLDQDTIMEQIITKTNCVSAALKEKLKKRPTRIKSNSFPQKDMVLFDQPLEEPLAPSDGQKDILDDCALPPELLDPQITMEQLIIERLLKAEFEGGDNITEKRSTNTTVQIGTTTINRFGFPNIGMSCYMNSSLQSLLMMEDFIRGFSCQERVWSSVPSAKLIRCFMAIRDARSSRDLKTKSRLLRSFKKVLSIQAPEFRDRQQKDAHEFLTTVLDQTRSLSPFLQDIAFSMGRRYTCPVEDQLMFRMENTRTCKRCGEQSKRQEEFTNLSLDLIPGGSVEQMLHEYMDETELEYRCECGGRVSGQKSEFETLPRVLILHLKRFHFTPFFNLVKRNDPVELLRDVVVSSKQGGACYSLISAISHFGFTGEGGHYICDGIHPDDSPDEPTDRWLSFNDSKVSETTGETVCEQRQHSAYILFYKRHL